MHSRPLFLAAEHQQNSALMDSVLSFRIVVPKERTQVLNFIEDWGHQWHGCSPPPSTEDIIVAWEGSTVVGVVSFNFADGVVHFPLEEVYNFDRVRKCFPSFKRSIIAQGGKWFATKKGVSRQLLHVIAEHLAPLGVQFLLCQVKDHALQRIIELGISCVAFHGIFPDASCVHPVYRKYYTDEPIPRLILMPIEELFLDPSLTLLS